MCQKSMPGGIQWSACHEPSCETLIGLFQRGSVEAAWDADVPARRSTFSETVSFLSTSSTSKSAIVSSRMQQAMEMEWVSIEQLRQGTVPASKREQTTKRNSQ